LWDRHVGAVGPALTPPPLRPLPSPSSPSFVLPPLVGVPAVRSGANCQLQHGPGPTLRPRRPPRAHRDRPPTAARSCKALRTRRPWRCAHSAAVVSPHCDAFTSGSAVCSASRLPPKRGPAQLALTRLRAASRTCRTTCAPSLVFAGGGMLIRAYQNTRFAVFGDTEGNAGCAHNPPHGAHGAHSRMRVSQLLIIPFAHPQLYYAGDRRAAYARRSLLPRAYPRCSSWRRSQAAQRRRRACRLLLAAERFAALVWHPRRSTASAVSSAYLVDAQGAAFVLPPKSVRAFAVMFASCAPKPRTDPSVTGVGGPRQHAHLEWTHGAGVCARRAQRC
jgi:hypothetical protein